MHDRKSRNEGRKTNANRAVHLTLGPLAIGCREGGTAEGPKLIPDEIVDESEFCSADFAEDDVQAEHSWVGKQEQDTHVHEQAAKAHDTEFGEADDQREEC